MSTVAIFCFNSCITDFSFVKVFDKRDVPDAIWNALISYSKSDNPVYLYDESNEFKDFIENAGVKTKKIEKPCDFIVMIHAN